MAAGNHSTLPNMSRGAQKITYGPDPFGHTLRITNSSGPRVPLLRRGSGLGATPFVRT